MLKMIPLTLLLILLFPLLTGLSYGTEFFKDVGTVKPPDQPNTGPGGSSYPYREIVMYSYGEGSSQYWIFEPASPRPATAPVIIFNHGWMAMHPFFYQEWIDHLVRKGNIVIYPRYQEGLSTPSDEFTSNSMQAVKDALTKLEGEGHVHPQLDKVAVVGHSVGGLISINYAARAEKMGLPIPRAVFCVEPGRSRDENRDMGPILDDLSQISGDTLLLTLAGEDDDWVGRDDAQRIYKGTIQIPENNKNYLLLVTDEHGHPELIADHFAPLAPNQRFPDSLLFFKMLNALDYYGTWKLFDGLYEAAFYGKNREYALGNTSQQRYMGIWSDGVPVKEILVIE